MGGALVALDGLLGGEQAGPDRELHRIAGERRAFCERENDDPCRAQARTRWADALRVFHAAAEERKVRTAACGEK